MKEYRIKEYRKIFRSMSSIEMANTINTLLCQGRECSLSIKFTLESIGNLPKEKALERAIELIKDSER